MIPKIAWMHWTGKPMNWLRRQAIRTFQKHNPSWDLRVIDTPHDIRGTGIGYAQQADWTWWRMLHKHGGFLVASDVISCGAVPDEWTLGDLCAQTRGGDIYQFAALGAAPGNELMLRAEKRCRVDALQVATSSADVYQSMGVNMLRHITRNEIDRFGKLVEMPEEAYCFYDWDQDPYSLWTEDGPAGTLPDTALGVHWYGGHVASKEREWSASKNGPSWLERFASK